VIGWSGVLLMAGGVLAFAGALFALLAAKRPNAEYRLTAALLLACAATAIGTAYDAAAHVSAAALPERIGLILSFAFVAQLAAREGFARRAPKARLSIYLAAAGLVVVEALWPPGSKLPSIISYVWAVATAIALLASLARVYIDGRREVGGAIFGAGLLLVMILHDALLDATPSSVLVPLGFVALAAGLTAKLGLEHVEVRQRLDARKRELRTRTRELMHSNDELRATQATLSTKEQLAAVGELAAVVAHEVRNPLAILGNAVSSLRKETLAPEDRTTLLEIIDSEASRLNRIVTDLLSFSRPITVQRGTVQVAELIDRALSLAAKKTEIHVDRQVTLEGARVWADRNLLRQVFDNLVENAMQAMESGGTLTVRVRPGEEGAVAVEIIDTGEGMDTAVRARAKDPFFTTRPSGTGLGLAIVDRIVAAHGGRLEIDSHAGEGTKVTIHLPASSSEPPTSRPSFDPFEPGSGQAPRISAERDRG
jgi:signal transduction histidine kinase